MVSADLEGIRLPHNKPNFSSFLMLQKLHRTGASLLPLIAILIESIKLGFPEKTVMIVTITKFKQITETLDVDVGERERTDRGWRLRLLRLW